MKVGIDKSWNYFEPYYTVIDALIISRFGKINS